MVQAAENPAVASFHLEPRYGFDVDNDGYREATEWLAPSEAILGLERDNNGALNTANELFNGVNTPFSWAGYQIYDLFAHENWPPHDGSNMEFIKSLNCSLPHPAPSVKERESWRQHMLDRAVDRQNFLIQPQCGSILFLASEGSHTRVSFDILDVERKKRTARVVITFD